MTYQPIESYGMIGDMHTVALVGKGSARENLGTSIHAVVI
jgi:hypothetical protein